MHNFQGTRGQPSACTLLGGWQDPRETPDMATCIHATPYCVYC